MAASTSTKPRKNCGESSEPNSTYVPTQLTRIAMEVAKVLATMSEYLRRESPRGRQPTLYRTTHPDGLKSNEGGGLGRPPKDGDAGGIASAIA